MLVAFLTGCSALHAARIGAPAKPNEGPGQIACVEALKYQGTEDAARGLATANARIRDKRLVFVNYGTRIVFNPRPRYDVRREQLLASYGITYEEGGHELPPEGEHWTYRCHLDRHIRQRFGDDFWLRIDAEARR